MDFTAVLVLSLLVTLVSFWLWFYNVTCSSITFDAFEELAPRSSYNSKVAAAASFTRANNAPLGA